MDKILLPDILKEIPEIEKACKIINTITLTTEEKEIYDERLKLLQNLEKEDKMGDNNEME